MSGGLSPESDPGAAGRPEEAEEALEEVAPEDTPEELGEVSTEGVFAPTMTLFEGAEEEEEENGPILRVSKGLLTRCCSEHSPYLT